jgi:UDPglucose 6-dehydrogenase
MHTVVYGLWHLGCVTAACLATAGRRTVGLDLDEATVAGLRAGKPPLFEPGLAELLAEGAASGRLSFTSDSREALREADLVWVTFDTPVDEQDRADVEWVRERLDAVVEHIPRGALVLVSSQVPVGFTGALERDWTGRGLRFASSPENLRLGRAIESFTRAERVVVGRRDAADEASLAELFRPFTSRIEWMSVESAEMTKHALNAFLATSVAFGNEVARLCEAVGADAKEVERGLKSDVRVGPRAYVAPGPAFAGGTLARDLRYLTGFGRERRVETPLLEGALRSNDSHKGWLRDKVAALLSDAAEPVVAVLGLTYKPGTSTLRRSASVELCTWLLQRGVTVRAHDPAIRELPTDLGGLKLCADAGEALRGADLAVLATEWPDYRSLTPRDILGAMRRPRIVDQAWFLAGTLSGDSRVLYVAPGRAVRP